MKNVITLILVFFINCINAQNNKQEISKNTMEFNKERYNGKPLLILLDNYVLDCIGHFDKSKEVTMISVVKSQFGGDEDWKKTIRKELQLPDNLDADIKRIWLKNQEIALENNTVLQPSEFTIMFVDQNFKALFEN